MLKGLYVNHKVQHCGVYEFGREIGNLLTTSKKFSFDYCECDTLEELKENYQRVRPDIIIYNYHPSTMGWVQIEGRWNVPIAYQFKAVHIGTIHEVYQQAADLANNRIFDFHIAPDPTLLLKNPIVFKTGRLLPKKAAFLPDRNKITVIGSFGFAMPKKGFEKIISLVQEEFDDAIIKLNIPYAKFGDTDGTLAREVAAQCKKLLIKDSIRLEINHDYLSKPELLKFLSGNSINVFLYEDQEMRGISSVIDWALAAGRPIAISKSRLFRHLFHCKPSICIEDNSLKGILANGTVPLKKLCNDFDHETILWEYERIVEESISSKDRTVIKRRSKGKFFLNKVFKKIGLYKDESLINQSVWTKANDELIIYERPLEFHDFKPVDLPPNTSFNRILDNLAREQYKKAINFLIETLPELIKKKIPEANIQQAFVFDTAVRFIEKFDSLQLLAVGAFEDTAVEALKLLNYSIKEIDPIFNYDLATYLKKPNVRAGMYDIVISTSVIEHVEHDEQFLKDIAYLLKKGGYAILTCDYKDQYKNGDEIPAVDYRFYTQKDIKERLLKAIPDCRLIDEPKWDCENPDFFLIEKYNYTFASIVFQKMD